MLPDHSPLISFTLQARSRYSETDKMGYVYHGRFLEYFEMARTEFIRDTGLPYKVLEDRGIMLPVRRAEIDFKRPVYYDELMDVSMILYSEPDVRLETYYKITTGNSEKPNVTGHVQLVFIDSHSRRPVNVPDEFLEGIRRYKESHG